MKFLFVDNICPQIEGGKFVESESLEYLLLSNRGYFVPIADFKTYLKKELLERISKNPQYSLRAFASHLGVDPSTLSKMINGKRAIGPNATLQLAAKLGLTKTQVKQLLNTPRNEIEGPDMDFKFLDLDQFTVVSDWFHFAILELAMTKDFKTDRNWIANSLGINSSEADAAIERLVRVGLLEITESGKWIDCSSGFTTNIGASMASASHRKLQKQLLTKAISAQQVQADRRDHSAMTMAINSSRIPEAKERIRKFRRSLTNFLLKVQKKTLFSV